MKKLFLALMTLTSLGSLQAARDYNKINIALISGACLGGITALYGLWTNKPFSKIIGLASSGCLIATFIGKEFLKDTTNKELESAFVKLYWLKTMLKNAERTAEIDNPDLEEIGLLMSECFAAWLNLTKNKNYKKSLIRKSKIFTNLYNNELTTYVAEQQPALLVPQLPDDGIGDDLL